MAGSEAKSEGASRLKPVVNGVYRGFTWVVSVIVGTLTWVIATLKKHIMAEITRDASPWEKELVRWLFYTAIGVGILHSVGWITFTF